MMTTVQSQDPQVLADKLHFQQKVDRALDLIREAWHKYGDSLVVANSLGKDSCVVWDLVQNVNPDITGFIVITRYALPETLEFLNQVTTDYPQLTVYSNDDPLPANLHQTDPDRCCELLKVQPTRRALQDLDADCWVTGLRCTEGRTRRDYREIESRDDGLIKLNPILTWHEREVWQYIGLHDVPVNPAYALGYRSLGCAPCTEITTDSNERAGRWAGTSKCGGECGIHTRPLISDRAEARK